MRIKISNYALLDTLKALKSSGIDEVTITKEDNDLILVVNTNLYKTKSKSYTTETSGKHNSNISRDIEEIQYIANQHGYGSIFDPISTTYERP